MQIFMRLLLFAGLWVYAVANGQLNESSVLTNPSISKRCHELKRDKDKILSVKQRLSALIERNRRLRQRSSKDQKNLQKITHTLQGNLKREFALVKTRLANLNENLIRKGCPGINF